MQAANRQTPRVLLLIPSYIPADTAAHSALGTLPRADYHALRQRLGADILDYSAVDAGRLPVIARIARSAGRSAALAALGYAYAADYDIIFTNGENVGIPYALLTRLRERTSGRIRAGHVMIGHRLSPLKKRMLLKAAQSHIDAVFVYSAWQREFACSTLGFEDRKLIHIPFHADHQFFRSVRPASESNFASRTICSAGMEWRDYATLAAATAGLEVDVYIGAYSPWSRSGKSKISADKQCNIFVDRYSYEQLRDLYDKSLMVVAPLLQTDFQAGITTIIEAMSMGKAVIATRTLGMADTLSDNINCLLVPPGDVDAMRQAIKKLIDNPGLATKLGAQARYDVETSLTLDHWVDRITSVICAVDTDRHCSATEPGAATGRKQ